MIFDYRSYCDLIRLLQTNGYAVSDYADWQNEKKCVILRHDIDYDIHKSLMLAEKEAALGVASNYFVLLTTDFYNVFSRKNGDMLREIAAMGHHVGLHFDEMNYPEIAGEKEKVIRAITKETRILEDALNIPIKSFSYHRPSHNILRANLEIPGLINSYSDVFFHEFKYLSDSRRRWREPVEDIISSDQYDRLHILTHAFWYHDEELSLAETLNRFLQSAPQERKTALSENFTNLEEALGGG